MKSLLDKYLDELRASGMAESRIQEQERIIKYVYRDVRRKLDEGNYPEVEIPGLGKFECKPFKLRNEMKASIKGIRKAREKNDGEKEEIEIRRFRHAYSLYDKMKFILIYKKSKLKSMILNGFKPKFYEAQEPISKGSDESQC